MPFNTSIGKKSLKIISNCFPVQCFMGFKLTHIFIYVSLHIRVFQFIFSIKYKKKEKVFQHFW